MGVPKFYRWLSERYPCLSEVVKEQQIPGFDNLYLDMNGIIHNCSHPNDEDPHFRIAEDKIFADIFHYIEFLFRMIKPQKVFFMAVDGVAPRAKMNQQRGRRFRTARDAELLRQQAIDKGEILPAEKQFDSNCITPGTEFMVKLHTQLKFFVSMKISTDKNWQKCNVYLSGHETPGEGEHKIMDFIRYHKAQPDYDPNTRHCLYGLDADLIMLGLCSHEPHFSVLREEVTYGKKNQKREQIPEQITFHLLHLSLLRDYISHEFQAVKRELPFPFDLEKIIDDWVMMGFLVGNDFIPNIPGLHINKNALPALYKSYLEVLPKLEGYINENGFLNLKRFEVYLKRLAQMDYEQFKEVSGDFKYLESKMSNSRKQNQVSNSGCLLDGLAALGDADFEDTGFEDADSDNSDEITSLEFSQHKRNYYITKMDYEFVNKDVLKEQATEYVRAVQWNLHYYYNGIISWSWYYPHHYAPYISDVTDFSDVNLDFDMGQPFLPFQQLLGVLPEASKNLLPLPYQALMTEDDSPMKKFYPIDFKLDQNGKQNDWEAVVLIPFIDENLLVSCMEALDDRLSQDEKNRNKHGPHLLYTYSEDSLGTYKSTLPIYYPDISTNHARCEDLFKDLFRLPLKQLKKGLCDGVKLDSYTPGFPTLKHLQHTAELKKASVSVFNSPVRNDCMILTLLTGEDKDLMDLFGMLNKKIYVGWPHLKEAKVQAVSDGTNRIQLDERNEVISRGLSKFEKDVWRKRASFIDERYSGRWGVEIGAVDVLVEAHLMNGKHFVCGPGGQVLLEKQWSRQITAYALQAIVQDIPINERKEKIFQTMADLYPPGLECFYMGHPNYGSLAIVQDQEWKNKKIPVKICIQPQINLHFLKKDQAWRNEYLPLYQVALRLGIDRSVVSRFTGTFLVQTSVQESMNVVKVNIGLNLKFNKKNEEVPGYSHKGADGNWVYSQKTVETMGEYLEKFPELFDQVSANLMKDSIQVDELFPKGNGKEYIQNIQTWLKGLPCSSQERRTCGSIFLDPSVIQEIERIVDRRSEEEPKFIISFVEPHLLYRPLPSQFTNVPDASANYMLFDRVVNAREGYTVPLGLRGTIISLPGSQSSGEPEPDPDALYDIVFDDEFPGGISLNCSRYRGYRLGTTALINLSYGLRANKSSHDSPRKQEHQARPITNSNNSYAKAFQSPRPSANLSGDNMIQNKPLRNPNALLDNGMVRLERTGGKPRRRIQEVPPTNTHQFNHSPDSPFVPHLLSSSENKFFPVENNTNNMFITPKALSNPSVKRNQQPALTSSIQKKDVPVSTYNASQDEFTSIWGELQQANRVPQISPNHSLSQNKDNTMISGLSPSSTFKAGFTKVSVDEIMQQAKAAEKLKKQDPVPPPPTTRSAVMQLMNLISSTTGELPVYKYITYGPTPLFGAEVILPGWQKAFHSTRFHPSKELASENAAEQALLALQNLSSVPVGPNVRPALPHPFKSGAFPPVHAPLMGRDPRLSVAALMLPVVPQGGRLPMPQMRAPPPPNIYNIPPSYVTHNHLLASQWEKQKLEAQQESQNQQLRPHRTKQMRPQQPLYQPPQSQTRKPGSVQQQTNLPLNINAMEFVPTQVARKQAVSKHKAETKGSSSTVTLPKMENLSLSVSDPTPAPPVKEEEDTKSDQNKSAGNSDSHETQSPSTSNVPKRKGRSRLAVKFINKPD